MHSKLRYGKILDHVHVHVTNACEVMSQHVLVGYAMNRSMFIICFIQCPLNMVLHWRNKHRRRVWGGGGGGSSEEVLLWGLSPCRSFKQK